LRQGKIGDEEDTLGIECGPQSIKGRRGIQERSVTWKRPNTVGPGKPETCMAGGKKESREQNEMGTCFSRGGENRTCVYKKGKRLIWGNKRTKAKEMSREKGCESIIEVDKLKREKETGGNRNYRKKKRSRALIGQ